MVNSNTPLRSPSRGERLIPYAARKGPNGEIHRPSIPAAFRRLNESGSSVAKPFPIVKEDHPVEFRLLGNRKDKIIIENQFFCGTEERECDRVTGPARPNTKPRIVLIPPTKKSSVSGTGLP